MRQHLISVQNLNVNIPPTEPNRIIEAQFGKAYAQIKKQPNCIEQAFLFWYQSVFGDEWRLIADIINYHPFTKGGLREPEEIKYYFFGLNEQRGHILSNKIQHDGWRNLEMPLLIN